MNFNCYQSVAVTALLGLASLAASAGLPNTDLRIQLREVAERDTSAYSVGTQRAEARLAEQSVSVKNGEKASLRINVSMPLQWVQKVEAQSSASMAPGSTGQTSGAGITNALTWLDAGQSFTVTPRWPDSKQPVSLEIELQTATVSNRAGSGLPQQTRSQISTTINAAMGEWVTIARSGQREKPGSYSSSVGSDAPQLIQIRVTVD